MSETWADTDGLAGSADSYDDKAAQIDKVAFRIQELIDPGYLGTVVGDDFAANKFLEVHLKAATDLRDGVLMWGEAVRANGEKIRTSARMLASSEHANEDEAAAFARTMTTDTSGGATTPALARSGEQELVQPSPKLAPLQPRIGRVAALPSAGVDPIPATPGVPAGAAVDGEKVPLTRMSGGFELIPQTPGVPAGAAVDGETVPVERASGVTLHPQTPGVPAVGGGEVVPLERRSAALDPIPATPALPAGAVIDGGEMASPLMPRVGSPLTPVIPFTDPIERGADSPPVHTVAIPAERALPAENMPMTLRSGMTEAVPRSPGAEPSQ